MPNWCANAVTIEATEIEGAQILRRLKNHIDDGNGLFSFINPIPPELDDIRTGSFGGEDAEEKNELRDKLIEKYGYSGWYDWCLTNWGTKWDARIEECYIENDVLTIYFDTAWSPPIPIYQELFEKHNMLVKASFVEIGANYIGYFNNGEYHDEVFITEFSDNEDDEVDYFENVMKYMDDRLLPTPSHTGG